MKALNEWRITQMRVTPIAFRDPPLLNAVGIHEPYALRSIVELETNDGLVGIAETYGDEGMLKALETARELIEGFSPFDLNGMDERVKHGVKATKSAGFEMNLAPGSHGAKNAAKVMAAFEGAMLDLIGQRLGAPVCDVLGGAVRDSVPYSAYLFFKYAEHIEKPYAPDAWGEGISPEQIVAQARRMRELYGFGSIKLKGGVFDPAHEVACIAALAQAFPGVPLRLDPNANWTLETSIKHAPALNSLLEYYEDPTPTLDGMNELAKHTTLPLATNMVVTSFEELKQSVRYPGRGPVQVVLSDHHYWGGLRATQTLARICDTFGLGVSMHSNSHLAPSLIAMTHLAAAVPNLSYACDTHYPWQEEEVAAEGHVKFVNGSVTVPRTPGLGVTLDREQLRTLNEQYKSCGIRTRNDTAEMKKYDPSFTGKSPRY